MLTHKVAIYVPSTVKGNKPAPAALIKKWLGKVKRALAQHFGGFTAYKAQGGWVSAGGALIEENVVIVQAFTDEAGLSNVPAIKALAAELAADMEQEAVSVEVDGTLHFVSAPALAVRTA